MPTVRVSKRIKEKLNALAKESSGSVNGVISKMLSGSMIYDVHPSDLVVPIGEEVIVKPVPERLEFSMKDRIGPRKITLDEIPYGKIPKWLEDDSRNPFDVIYVVSPWEISNEGFLEIFISRMFEQIVKRAGKYLSGIADIFLIRMKIGEQEAIAAYSIYPKDAKILPK